MSILCSVYMNVLHNKLFICLYVMCFGLSICNWFLCVMDDRQTIRKQNLSGRDVVSKTNVTCIIQRTTNDQVLCEANTVRKQFNKIKQRQCRFIGHGIRGEGMENLVTTGKIQGKRYRGRQVEKILDGVCRWLGVKGMMMIRYYSINRQKCQSCQFKPA